MKAVWQIPRACALSRTEPNLTFDWAKFCQRAHCVTFSRDTRTSSKFSRQSLALKASALDCGPDRTITPSSCQALPATTSSWTPPSCQALPATKSKLLQTARLCQALPAATSSWKKAEATAWRRARAVFGSSRRFLLATRQALPARMMLVGRIPAQRRPGMRLKNWHRSWAQTSHRRACRTILASLSSCCMKASRGPYAFPLRAATLNKIAAGKTN